MPTTTQSQPQEHVLPLTAHPKILAGVREDVGSLVVHWGFPELNEDAVLLVTELLANVHRHVPDKRCTLRLAPIADGVVIEVADRSMKPPELKAFNPLAENGNGIRLIDALSKRRWCWVPTDEGKKIVCTLKAA